MPRRKTTTDEILDQPMADEAPPSVAHGPVKVSYTHEAMMDYMIANPGVSQNQIAEHFGYTPSWVSMILTSDAFRAKYAERRDAIVAPELRGQVKQNFEAILLRAQDVVMQKLNLPTNKIPASVALRAIEVSSRAAGYGAKVGEATPVEVNVEHHLTILGDNLTSMLRKGREAIEGEVVAEGGGE